MELWPLHLSSSRLSLVSLGIQRGRMAKVSWTFMSSRLSPPPRIKKMSEGSTVSRRGLVNKLAGRKLKHDQQAACLKTQQVKSSIPWNWFQRGNA